MRTGVSLCTPRSARTLHNGECGSSSVQHQREPCRKRGCAAAARAPPPAAARRLRPLAAAAGPAAAGPAAADGSTQEAEQQQSQQQQQQQQAQQPHEEPCGGGAHELPLLLDGLRVVLVSPKTPANIGSVLRLTENFEAHDVVVVEPRCDPFCDEVAVTSCDSAVLRRLRVAPSLAAALADCAGSVGFTRRAGAGRVVHASLAQLLARFPGAVPALSRPAGAAADATTDAPVALVFGREESGLLESELLLCSHACSIPSGRSQPSLNLSHAVGVVLSQLFDARQQRLLQVEQQGHRSEQQGRGQQEEQRPQEQATPFGSLFESERVRWQRQQALGAASQAELEALLARAAALLERAGIDAAESTGGGDRGNHGRKRRLMGHVRALLLRSQASTAEVRALHGLCKELEAR